VSWAYVRNLGGIFLDKTIVSANRFHHGYIIEVTEDSYRKKMSKAANGCQLNRNIRAVSFVDAYRSR